MVGPAAKREAVAHLRRVLETSDRRACTLVAADRKMVRYRLRRAPDVELRAKRHDLPLDETSVAGHGRLDGPNKHALSLSKFYLNAVR